VPGFDVVMPAIADILPFFEGTGPNPLDAVVAYLLTLE
jgi:hypothetical protein